MLCILQQFKVFGLVDDGFRKRTYADHTRVQYAFILYSIVTKLCNFHSCQSEKKQRFCVTRKLLQIAIHNEMRMLRKKDVKKEKSKTMTTKANKYGRLWDLNSY